MFVPLETKTVYSFMESLIDIETYILRGKELGYRHLGIMDRDNLYAAYHFIQKATMAGIKPIVGLATSLTYQDKILECRLVALNTTGYRHLMKVSTEIMSGDHDLEALIPYSEGILLIIPYFDGIMTLQLPISFVIGVGLDTPALPFEQAIIPLHQVTIFDASDVETLQMLRAIKDNVPLTEVPAIQGTSILLPEQEMASVFEERFPGCLSYLNEMVDSISYTFDKQLKLPRFNRSKEPHIELRERTVAGLKEKGLFSEVYQERLEKELSIIHEMGFEAINNGDLRAMAVFKHYCRNVAIMILNIQTVINGFKVVIGGGISAQPILIEEINNQFDKILQNNSMLNNQVIKPVIVAAKHGNESNLYGALYALLLQLKEKENN